MGFCDRTVLQYGVLRPYSVTVWGSVTLQCYSMGFCDPARKYPTKEFDPTKESLKQIARERTPTSMQSAASFAALILLLLP